MWSHNFANSSLNAGMNWGVRIESVIATNIFTYAHAATWWRSLVRYEQKIPESIMTKERRKKRRRKNLVESTESPVNWIEPNKYHVSGYLGWCCCCWVFFSLSFTCVCVCMCQPHRLRELQFLVIGINVWSLPCVCVVILVVISNIVTFFYITIAFCMHADIPNSFFAPSFLLFFTMNFEMYFFSFLLCSWQFEKKTTVKP